jgi:hypothetical protein
MKDKRRTREGSSSRGGDGAKGRGKPPADKKKKKNTDPSACRRCREVGHWARECPEKKPEKKEAHLARDDSDDECALLMGEYCALQEGEAREAEAKQGIVPQAVELDESRVCSPWSG